MACRSREGPKQKTTLCYCTNLYASNTAACNESMYGTEGTSPCDDVLLIPINNTILFQFIKISVANYLQLCEVQIFAGKCHFIDAPVLTVV